MFLCTGSTVKLLFLTIQQGLHSSSSRCMTNILFTLLSAQFMCLYLTEPPAARERGRCKIFTNRRQWQFSEASSAPFFFPHALESFILALNFSFPSILLFFIFWRLFYWGLGRMELIPPVLLSLQQVSSVQSNSNSWTLSGQRPWTQRSQRSWAQTSQEWKLWQLLALDYQWCSLRQRHLYWRYHSCMARCPCI